MQPVGILGGSFDPIHIGHLAIAEEARWALGLARVYLVPAAQQPMKPFGAASPEQRLEMVRRACRGNPALAPADLELRRSPPSYTVDTLAAFQARLGADVPLWFILGADAALDLPRWQRAEQIIALARLAVIQRPGATLDLAALEARLAGISSRMTLIDGPRLDISSTELRERLAAGRPVRYQIPDAVLAYIEANGLYGRRQEAGGRRQELGGGRRRIRWKQRRS